MREQELSQQAGVVHGLEHCLRFVERHALLAVVADCKRFAAFYLSGGRGEVPGQKIDEGALTHSVTPDDAHLLVSLEVVSEMRQVASPVVEEADILAVDDLGAESRGLPDFRAYAHLLCRIYLFRPVLQLVECVDAVFCLSCTGAGRGVYPLQLPAQDITDLVRLGVVVVDAFLALDQVVLIVPLVDIDCAVVKLHHGIADPVEEIPVVRDHEQGAARVRQITLKILDRIGIKVVRGLVHDKEIGL